MATSPSPDQPPVLYKVHTDWKSGGASWGDTKYYEGKSGRAKMAEDLLEHHLDIGADHTGKHREDRVWRIFDLWAKWLRKGKEPKARCTRIYKVERFTESGWVPVEVEFVMPAIYIKDQGEGQQ